MLLDLLQKIIEQVKMPEGRRDSVIVRIFKEKGASGVARRGHAPQTCVNFFLCNEFMLLRSLNV